MNIYTKTGDNGTSGLIGGSRVSKDDVRLEAYGSVDELNSFLGMLAVEHLDIHDVEYLKTLQHHLFKIGSYLATDQKVTSPTFPEPISKDLLKVIENEIDTIVSSLPELHQFVLPGGNRSASLCHICRSISRRAERNVVRLSKQYNVDSGILVYLNRMSDYFFVLARKCCLVDSQEIFWDQSK